MEEGVTVEYVWMILRMDLVSLLSRGRRGERKSKIQLGLVSLMYIALGVGTYYGAYRLFDYLESNLAPVPGMADAVAVNIFNGLAIYVLVIVFLSGLQVTFRTLYESDDIGFLISQPVPAQSVFAAKFITAYTTLVPMTLVFVVPVWFAWGYVNRAGFLFYLMMVLSFMLLLLTVHAAVTLILLFAMRYLPGAKLKRLFVAVGAILGLFIVFTSQMLSSRISTGADPMEVLKQIGSVNLSKTWYLPTAWAVNSILGTVSRFGVNLVHYALPLVCSAIAFAWLAVKMSEQWYFAGWSGLGEGTSTAIGMRRTVRKPKAYSVRDAVAGDAAEASPAVPRVSGGSQAWIRGSSRMQGTFWTVLRKDLKLLFRDPVLWYGLATSAIVLGFFAYNTIRAGATGGNRSLESAKGMISGTIVMMPCLMGSVIGAQTGGISLSREGSCFWLLQANPTDGANLFRAKFIYAMLPSVVLMLPFFVIIEFAGLPHYQLWRELLSGLSIATTVASFQILLDAYLPDFTIRVEIGSSKSGKGKGKLVTVLLASIGVVMVLVLLVMLPTILVATKAYPESSFARLDIILHGLVAALALLMIYASNRFGSRQVERLLKST